MNVLTINVFLEDEQTFFENNKGVLERAKKIEGLEIQLGKRGECYEEYLNLLEGTVSKYVIFYNDENQICLNGIVQTIDKLKNSEETVLCQKVDKENVTNEYEYRAGGMDPNPFYFSRYIFKTQILKTVAIEKSEIPFFTDKIVIALIQDKEFVPVIPSMVIYTDEGLENQARYYKKQFQKEWYIPYFEEFVLPFVKKKELTVTEQRIIVHMILRRFYMNQNGRNKFVLNDEEVEYFFRLIKILLGYIDDIYLIETRQRQGFVQYFAYWLLKEKQGQGVEFSVRKTTKILEYLYGNNVYGKDCLFARIKAINYEKESLIIDGEIVGDYCLEDVDNDFFVIVNNEKYSWKKTEVFNLDTFFGRILYRYTAFQIEIPQVDMQHKVEMRFEGIIKGEVFKLPIKFHKRVSSRLERSHWSYWTFERKIITFSSEKIVISNNNLGKQTVLELGHICKLLKENDFEHGNIKAAALRTVYWLTKKHYCKMPNWIFYDKLYKAGDNAEYLFQYCVENYPEKNSYYIVTKESVDYKRLKKMYGSKILCFGSLRQKLIVLNAQIIFATHAGVWGFCGFNGKMQRYLKSLLNAKIVCIQHGLTIQNIARYQNRLKDNTHKYFCASKYEIENLKNPIYGYQKDELYLTGCPRYDGLKNNEQKQILIAPTWRRNIVITGNAIGTSKEYNPEFKNTKYFELYNRLINDKRLLEIAKKYEYKITFLIHPTLSSQVDDYDKNDYTSIIPAVSEISYEKMLTESSVMVTDYSGIQFDFAYMKKPILYYQPKELPPQYEEGVYKYKEQGFGPIIEEYEDLIQRLCDTIKDGCKMKEKYLQRVDDFFEYTDYSNCARIMNVIENSGM